MAHELDARLRAVETSQARVEQLITDNIRVTSTLLTKHDKVLYGTGESDNPGIVTRLDREEQSSKNFKRTLWIIASSFIGIAAKFTYDYIPHLFHH